MKAAPFILLIPVAVVGVVAGGLFWSGHLDPETQDGGPQTTVTTPQWVHLSAEGAIADTVVAFKNLDTFPWTDVEMVVSPTADGRGGWYSYKLDHAVGAGQIAGGMLTQFADASGHRFDPFALKARAFMISATTPNGRGTWSGTKE